MIIDAKDLILGRMASYVAKLAMQGENIVVVNCEKAVVSGKRRLVEEIYLGKRERGDAFHGPFFPRRADMMVRRTIRGMLPRKTERGRKAFKRVMCYLGVPNQYAEQKLETIKKASVDNLRTGDYITIKKISARLGLNHG